MTFVNVLLFKNIGCFLRCALIGAVTVRMSLIVLVKMSLYNNNSPKQEFVAKSIDIAQILCCNVDLIVL